MVEPAFVFDLETCLMKKGIKRPDTIILSIAAIDLYTKRCFNMFLKPPQITTTEELREYLVENNARVDSSLQVLSNINYDIKNAVEIKEALLLFKSFLIQKEDDNPYLLAHNGKSFDFKILLGNLSKNDIKLSFTPIDTYRDMCQKIYRFKSYNLGSIYRNIIAKEKKIKISWHNAYDDCLALKAIVIEASKKKATQEIVEYFNTLVPLINKMYGVKLQKTLTLHTSEKKILTKALSNAEIHHGMIMNSIIDLTLQKCKQQPQS